MYKQAWRCTVTLKDGTKSTTYITCDNQFAMLDALRSGHLLKEGYLPPGSKKIIITKIEDAGEE